MPDVGAITYQAEAAMLSSLRKVPLFASLFQEDLVKICRGLRIIKASRGEKVCREGDPGDALYIIRSGMVAVTTRRNEGERTINYLHKGEIFGEISLLTGEPRSATVKVILDAELFVLSKNAFEEIIRNNPLVSVHLNRILSHRLKQSLTVTQQEISLCFYSVIGSHQEVGSSIFLADIAATLSSEAKKRVLIVALNEEGIQCEVSHLAHAPVPDPQLLEDVPPPYRDLLSKCWFQHPSGFAVFSLFSAGEQKLIPILRANLSSTLAILRTRYDHVFFDLSPTLNPLSRRALRLSDRTLFLSANTPEDVNSAKEKLSEIKAIVGEAPSIISVGVSHLMGRTGLHRSQIRDILEIPEVPEVWVDRREEEEASDLNQTFAKRMSGARRVAREIGGVRVGLVLGAGGARGWAHIGVLEALEKERVTVDMIAGTSIGALVGAIYAKTCSAEETLRLTVGKFPNRKTARKKIFDYTVPSRGFIKGNKILRMVEDAVEKADFLDLTIPLAVVAVDIHSGEPVVLNRGSVAEAVRSSIAIPGVMEPARIEQRWLVDGGLVNPVPADILIRKGIDFIIGVFLESRISKIEWDLRKGPNIINILAKSFAIITSQASHGITDLVDVAIHPKVDSFSWDDFHKGEELVRIGRDATYEVMDRIKELAF